MANPVSDFNFILKYCLKSKLMYAILKHVQNIFYLGKLLPGFLQLSVSFGFVTISDFMTTFTVFISKISVLPFFY